MKIDVDVNVHFPPDSAIERALTSIFNSLAFLKNQGVELMTAFSDFATKQATYNADIGAAIDGIVGDVKSLNDKITELQNSPGTISPADQALLDDLVTQGAALVARVKAADDLTPPVIPPVTI